ncbi:DUF4347 domain-containing protein, partial [Motiliproteus sp. MSK22-1]|uniref:DUF4347 domain-containing protein n=1 Tax=Motiliproteus sp. MSK22-1 TaxID=1897630 RepID=UPI00097887FB
MRQPGSSDTQMPSTVNMDEANNIVIIDGSLADPETLAAASASGAEVFVIDADRSGVEQVSEILSGRENVDSLHIMSHGGSGYVSLGSDVIQANTLSYYSEQLSGWGEALSESADLLLYGCYVGNTDDGVALVNGLADLTGADIAASTDLTGADAKGGDWELELKTGAIESSLIEASGYQGTLATYTVLNTNNSGAGSLRQAILDSNASGGADTIQFATTVSGTINLTSTLTISDDLTILGAGADRITLDGSGIGAGNIIDVTGVTEKTAVLKGMTVANAAAGKGIYVYGNNLSVEHLVVDNNSSDGIDFSGELFGYRSTLGVSHSTISNNDNGIVSYYHSGTTIGYSTITGNSTTWYGAGVVLSNEYGASTINYSTITGNTQNNAGASGGGMYVMGGNTNAVTVNHSVISGNTATNIGGISGDGVNLFSSIVANNTNNGANVQGGNNSGSSIIQETFALDALAQNGGPVQTISLPNGSTAIDAGQTLGLTYDARGYLLSSGGTPDIGAYESNSTSFTYIGYYFPSDDHTSVDGNTNLIMDFGSGMALAANAGNIVIKKTSDNSIVETIAATDAGKVSFSNGVVTINPATELVASTSYYVEIDAGAFSDGNGATFAGISGATTWNFSVDPSWVATNTDPVIDSATYNASTGVVTVTGSNFEAKTGALNDVDVSKLTFTGEGGDTYTVTSASDVEITSTTEFSFTLSGADKTNVDGLLNKNGTNSDTSNTTYNLAAADDFITNVTAGDTADATASITVSAVAVPTISSATYDISSGALVVTGTNFVNKNGATNDVDVTKLTLTGEGGATYTLTSTNVEITSATAFTVTLNAIDALNTNSLLNKDGTTADSGTTYNLAAADNWMQGAAASTDIADATGNGITVSNYTAPTVTSATYDFSNGQVVITGTNFVHDSGANNDIDASLLTFTGESGATYTLTDTSDVEITSATAATISLSSTDQLHVQGLMNKDGTVSGDATTYNLAAVEDWMAGSPASINVADLTANGITVSNVATPTVTSATYDVDTGILAVTGTNLFKKVGAANDIDISTITLTGGAGNATYTLTSASDVEITSATAFSVTLAGADKTSVDALLDQIGTSSSGGSTYNIAVADNWLAAADSATDIADATNAVTVSINPKITSSTYDASTGVFVVTGTNIQANGGGSDIDASLFTFTGEGGATYTLTDTADVERDSVSQFTLTLSATDKAAINQIFNKDGTSSTSSTTYNLAAADDWDTNVTAGDTTDTTGNGVTVSNVPAPSITSAAYDASTGSLVVTATDLVKASGAANDIDVSMLTFTGEGGSSYTLTDSSDVEITSGSAFTVTLSATDRGAVNQIVNKNGTASTDTTTYNLAAAEDWATGADASVNVVDATGNAITVSNVATPTITSTTYDASTGILVATGTGLLKKSGAANDIDVSMLTFAGEGGATYTLTDTSDVEITSGTSFTVTLSATDRGAVNQIINKDGTTSTGGSSYNLAAAEDWAAGADVSVNVVDATGNGVTASNVAAPTITSATYDYNSNTMLVTGTGFLAKSGATNDIDISKFTFTGEGGATYTLTSASDIEITSGTAFSVTLSGTDLVNVEALLNSDGTSADDSTTYNLAAAEDWAAGADAAVNVVDTTGNGITVSNYAVPTLTSASYDWSTGQLVLTGTNFIPTSGASNDVDASAFSFTGEGGGGSSYTLTDSADVEITSATTATLILSATDQLHIHGLLNKNGTTSDDSTTYNLAAAEDWMTGAPSANTVADLTGNGITVSNVAAPAVTSAGYDSDTGVLTVTGTNLFKNDGANNDIDISTITLTGGAGNATYTLTSTSDVEITSATSFSVTLAGVDKTNVDALLDQLGTSSSGGSTYNIAMADNWLTAADSATDISDATNAVTVTISPKITSSTYDATTGVLVVTGTNIQANGGGSDIDASLFTVTGEGGATYTLTDTADVERDSVNQFTLTLSATDKAAVNQIINKDGTASTDATSYNLAAADDWDTNVTSGDTADTTGNGITVSNVVAPTITSSTYDASTGILVVTGANLLSASGAANDIDVSMLTLTGEGGSTYTLTDSSDVDITSASAFTLTLSATDKAAISQMINKNGTSSTSATTYNLAAAEDWAAGADSAANVADTTGNGVTVSNVAAPVITSATYDFVTGTLAVTGTGFLQLSGAANDIDVSLLTLTGE